MKQKFTILIAAAVMLLAILLQPTRLWGQEKTDNKVYTLSITKNTSNNSYGNYYDISVSLIGWKAPGNQSLGAYIKIGGKLSSATDRYLYSKTAISGNINKVIVTHGTKDSQITVNSMTLKVYSTAADAAADKDPIATISGTYADNGTTTFTKPDNTDWSGCFYRLNYNLSSSAPSKNYGIIFTKAEFYTTTYTLTYSATNGDISGVLYETTTTVSSGGSVNKGGKVTLTAEPESGYSFYRWSVSGENSTLSSTSDNPTIFTMGTANATVTATFVSAGNYITVSPTSATPSCAAQNVAFSVDTDQTLDANPVVFYTTSTGDVTTLKPSWIGDLTSAYSSSTLTIPVADNTGAARTAYFRVEKGSVKSDVITINQAVYAPAAPTLPAAGDFDYTKEITITVPDGTTVYYTTNGNDPTSSSTPYTEPFTISATGSTTVKAIAYDGTYPSEVVSATYTRTYDYISSINSTATNYTVKGTVVATNTKGFVFGDATGYIYDFYDTSIPSVGSVVSITNQKVSTYGKVYEFKTASASASNSTYNSSDTPTSIDGDYIYTVMNGSTTYISNYQQFVGTLTKSGSNYFFEVAGSTHTSNAMISYPTDDQSDDLDDLDGEIVKVNGYFAGVATVSSTSYYSVMLESVEACPLITTSVTSISNFTYNVGGGTDAKSFTVSGANLTGDITVSTNSANFEISSDNETWQTSDITISKGSGTVAATTISVRLKSGLDSNTYNGKITVSSDGADDKEIALTGKVTHVIAYNTILPTGCSVSSEPNGAQVAGESVSVSATAGSGYKFSAWDVYKTGDATTKVDVEDDAFEMPDYNVTVSATFVEAYAVTYDANGGEGDMTDEDSPYISGSTVTVLTNTFTRDGYDFDHWDTKSTGDGTPYDHGDTFEISANTTLYAQWSKKSYNVALSSVDNVDLLASYDDKTIAEGKNANVEFGTEITLSATNMDAGKVFVWSVTKNEDSSDVTDDVLDGDVLTVPAYNITIGGQVAELFFQYSGELTEGDYIIARNSKAMNNTVTSNKFGTTNISSYIDDGEVVVANAADYTWHVAKITDTDYWTIMNGSNYAASTGTKSQAALVSSFNSKCRWSISGTSTYTIVSRYNDSTGVNAYLRLNSSDYACYANSNSDSYFYKKVTGSKHTVAIAAGITNGNPSASPSSAYEGQTIALTANPSTGYMLDAWDVYKTGDATTKVTVKGNSFTMPGYDVTVSATFRVPVTYTLVDGSTVKLEAGKHYIIAAAKNGLTDYPIAMSTQSGTIRDTVHISSSDFSDNNINEVEDLCEFVLSGDDTNRWTIYDITSQKYLSGGDRALNSIDAINDAAQWSISIDGTSNVATITNAYLTDYTLQYNSNSPRFACYSSSQRSVYLYKRDGDTELEFHSNTSLANQTLSASNTMTVESGSVLTLTGTSSCSDSSWLVVKDGGQLKVLSEAKGVVKATVQKEIKGYGATNSVTTGWNFIALPRTEDYEPDETMTSNTYDLYQLNDITWENYKEYEGNANPGFKLANGRGYLYANSNDVTLEFAGTVKPYDADHTISVSEGWNLIGNPYTFNAYVSVPYYAMNNDGSGITAETVSTSTAVKPCTGIVIKADNNGTVKFSDTAPVGSANNGNLQMVLAHKVATRDGASVNKTIDNAIVSFNEGGQLEKFHFGNPAASIFIPQNGEDYAIALSDRQDDVPLNFKANETGTYTISFTGDEMDLNGIYLIDILAEEEIDLSVNPSYTFIGSPADRMARFKIVFRNADGDSGSDIFAYQSGNDIIVSGEGELQIFDVMGRMVSRQYVSSVETINAMPYGVYIFKLNGMTQKIVVR